MSMNWASILSTNKISIIHVHVINFQTRGLDPDGKKVGNTLYFSTIVDSAIQHLSFEQHLSLLLKTISLFVLQLGYRHMYSQPTLNALSKAIAK